MKKMRQLFLFTILFLTIMLAACSSPEAEEILDIHNGYVDNVNPKIDEVDQVYEKINAAQSDEEVMDIRETELTSIVLEVKEYIDSQEPETEEAKEYHQIRADWASAWYDVIDLENKATQGTIDGSLTEEEITELLMQAEERGQEASELAEKGHEKIDELSEKYNFEDDEDR